MNTFLGQTVRDSVLYAGVGYVVGFAAKTSPEKVAAAFAISELANNIFCLFNHYTTHDKTSEEGKKSLSYLNRFTSVINSSITAIALYRMQLLPATGAFYLAYGSFFLNVILMSMK